MAVKLGHFYFCKLLSVLNYKIGNLHDPLADFEMIFSPYSTHAGKTIAELVEEVYFENMVKE